MAEVPTTSELEQPKEQAPAKGIDLKPFDVAPPLRFIRNLGLHDPPSAWTVLVIWSGILVVAVTWTAMFEQNFFPHGPGLGRDIVDFLFRRSTGHLNRAGTYTPFLRDYASILLLLIIATAVPLVYALFRSLEKLHTSLLGNHCIELWASTDKGSTVTPNSTAALDQLTSHVNNELNEKYERIGKRWWLTLPLCVFIVYLLNVSMKKRIFDYLIPPGTSTRSAQHLQPMLYAHWWASLSPIQPGGIVWVAAGGIGLYAFYAEAVVGLTYLSFLRRSQGKYRFGANRWNPDGFWGWSTLRTAVTVQQLGLVSSALTAFALLNVFIAACGIDFTIVLMAAILLLVFYVFFGAMAALRRHVREDKQDHITLRTDQLEALGEPSENMDLRELTYRQQFLDDLTLWRQVPPMPLRRSTYFIGLAAITLPTLALIAQILVLIGWKP